MMALMRLGWYKDYKMEIHLSSMSQDGYFQWMLILMDLSQDVTTPLPPEQQSLGDKTYEAILEYKSFSKNVLDSRLFTGLFNDANPDTLPSEEDKDALAYLFGKMAADVEGCFPKVYYIDVYDMSGYSSHVDFEENRTNGYTFEEDVYPERQAERNTNQNEMNWVN